MKESLEDWFKTARENYASSLRFAFLLIGFLLAIHLTTINQYLRTQRVLGKARTEIAAHHEARRNLQNIQASVQNLTAISSGRFNEALNEFVEGLTNDFRRLGDEIHALQNRSPSDAPTRRTGAPDVIQAAPVAQRNQSDWLTPLPENTIKENQPLDSMRQALAPWIHTNILTPRFQEIQNQWAAGLLPAIEKEISNIQTNLSDILALALAETIPTAPISGQLTNILSDARKVRFPIPNENKWWETVTGKGIQAREMASHVTSAMRTKTLGDDVRQLTWLADKMRATAESLATNLEVQLAEINKRFESELEKAHDLAKPLSFLAMDLAYFAGNFPLFIGLGVAVAIFWPAFRRQELLRAHRLLVRTDSEARIWSEALNLNRRSGARESAFVAAGLIWTVIAAWQLHSLHAAPEGDARRSAFWGAAALVVVALCNFRFAREAQRVTSP